VLAQYTAAQHDASSVIPRSGWVLRTVTVKLQLLELPQPSRASQVTVLVPGGKRLPEGGVETIVTGVPINHQSLHNGRSSGDNPVHRACRHDRRSDHRQCGPDRKVSRNYEPNSNSYPDLTVMVAGRAEEINDDRLCVGELDGAVDFVGIQSDLGVQAQAGNMQNEAAQAKSSNSLHGFSFSR
jgi:hypothetical protein